MQNIISQVIDDQIKLEEEVRKEEHIPSGKLSASNFGYPVQWQILRALGVEGKPFDPYTLRKFARGRDVEEWIVNRLDKAKMVLSSQKEVKYRDCIGYLDCLCFGTAFGIEDKFPVEVKSVTNLKFKRIVKQDKPDNSHLLQAGYYGVGLGLPFFTVCYVASDDYRIKCFTYKTEEVRNQINKIIDTFNMYWEKKEIPVFEAIEKWNSIPTYNSYPEWELLTEEELVTKAKELYGKK